jgi:hypothetical protein
MRIKIQSISFYSAKKFRKRYAKIHIQVKKFIKSFACPKFVKILVL